MEHILLLHGALGSVEQFDELETLLSKNLIVHTLNFSGHGGLPVPAGGFSIELFEMDVLNYLNKKEIDSVNIFGYSMGGYVALYLSLKHPHRIKSIFTLATKFDWSTESTAREIKLLSPETMERKIPSFVKTLQERHAPTEWRNVVQQTANMMQLLSKKPLSEKDFQKIEIPVRLAVGDCDQMVSINETEKVYRSLKEGSLLVLPSTQHPYEKIDITRLTNELKAFFNHVS